VTRRRWILAGLGLVVLGVVAVLSGVAPIAASSGHWAITEWVLHTTMRRTVAARTLGNEVPVDLEDPALVMRGAGHFERGCRPCHGAPGQAMPLIMQQAEPPPPRLDEPKPGWEPAELFWVIKHGLKFTGMPAWPSQKRDDEVWAMVAFLQAFPELDGAGYRALVHDDQSAPDEAPAFVVERCQGCHGASGQGRPPDAFPKLAGQSEPYLRKALDDYAAGLRHSGIMQPVAVATTPAERARAAAFYASLEPMKPSGSTSDTSHGETIARKGDVQRKVGACASCHGPSEHEHDPLHPRLDGQSERFLASQLRLFRDGRRQRERAATMSLVMRHGLEDQQIDAVAAYYARRNP